MGIADLIRAGEDEADVRHRTLSDLFVEEPVDLTTFVQDKKFLNLRSVPLSPVQFDAVRHMEQIFQPELYPLMVEEFGDYWKPVRNVHFLYLQWGKGSGKDHICRIISLRVAYLLLCLNNPQEYFNMPDTDSIHMLNVASSSAQANRAFFQPMKRAVERKGGWFSDKAEGSETKRAEASQFSIIYDKNLEAISGHSDAETQEGLNLILGVADEISAFRTKDEMEYYRKGLREPSKSAEGIIKMMRTSARTRFPRVFKVCAISFPRFKGDAIQQLTLRGREDNKKKGNNSRIYVDGPRATWDVRPGISKEDFQEDYDEDPVMAKAMYECQPEASTDRFFRNDLAIVTAMAEEKDPEPVEVEYWWGLSDEDEVLLERYYRDPSLPKPVPAWQVKFNFAPDFWAVRGAQYAVHGDASIRGDRAGVAMAHVKSWSTQAWLHFDDDGAETRIHERRPLVKLDFVFSFEADLRAQTPNGTFVPREVQVRWYRELAWELMRRGFPIQRYTFDGFQSTDAMQILESRGIETDRVSTDRNNDVWNTLKDVMYDGRLEGYYRGRVVNELVALTRKPNGRVDHPPYGSKDEADALGGAVYGAIELGGTEGQNPTKASLSDGFSESFAPTNIPRGMEGLANRGPTSTSAGLIVASPIDLTLRTPR